MIKKKLRSGSRSDKGLDQVNGIHTYNETFLLLAPVYATDANTVGCPIL